MFGRQLRVKVWLLQSAQHYPSPLAVWKSPAQPTSNALPTDAAEGALPHPSPTRRVASPDRAVGQRPRPKGPHPQVRYTCRANSSTSDNVVRGGRLPDHVLSARPNIGNGLIARCVHADAKLLEGASIATWRDRSCSSTHVGYLHHFSPRRTSTAHVRSIGISCMTSSAYIASGVRLFGNGLSRALRNIPERSSKLAQWPSGVDLAIWNSRGSIDWRDKVT